MTTRVLIVDDEEIVVRSCQRILAESGFEIDVASDGWQALRRVDENDYDIIILDIMLPGMNGYEVCRRLRQDGSLVPVLMLTAKDGEHDEADALDLGADDYLSKPFSFVVLLARLRALLRRAPDRRDPMLVCGDLSLDPAARRCWRGDVEVDLTAREFSLAEFLIRRKGRVVSRATIAEHVWDAELDIDSNVVEVYIGYLRRKLDKPFDRADIETVRGTGYRLREIDDTVTES